MCPVAFRSRRVRALVCLAALLCGASAHAGLTAEEETGKRIFTDGVSPSGGKLTARVGASDFDVPGSAVPCANCHGNDGLGRPEGGVVPPDIQWSELAKPYGHVHTNGRKHPAFDETALRKAIAYGVDPGGNELDKAMPRYNMSDADAKSLVAYIKKLEFQLPPGVSAEAIRIGTVLPDAGRFGEAGKAVGGVLEAYFDEINKRGGLYGRRLKLVVAKYGDRPETAYANAWELVRKGEVFLLLAPFSAGWEPELGRLAAEAEIPVIGPITLFPEDVRSSNLYLFHLLSGTNELAQVLTQYGGQALGLKSKRIALLHPATKAGRDAADAIQGRLQEQGFGELLRQGFTPGGADAAALARSLKEKKADAVLLLGTGLDVAALARAAAADGWLPYLLVPGPLAQRDIVELPIAFQDRVFLGYPTLPADQKPPALQEYAALFQSRPLIRTHQTLQVPAYAAAVAAVEALRESGKEVNRPKFMKALETMQRFDTGMVPPLSYNADRRIGALGGYVVGLDLAKKQFRPLGGFVALQR
jgi:ABC-type branched-subunit amino acid transport system substrate-binding protein